MRWWFVFFAGCGGADALVPDAARPADAAGEDAPLDAPLDAAFDAVLGPDAAADAAPPDASLPDGVPVAIFVIPCEGQTPVFTVLTSTTDFFPEVMTIAVGDVIRFAPVDPHDALAGTPAAPQPALFWIAGNDPGCVRFDEPGTFPFFCTAHPTSMTGVVTVEL